MSIEKEFIAILKNIDINSEKSMLETLIPLSKFFEDNTGECPFEGNFSFGKWSNAFFEILSNSEDSIKIKIAENIHAPISILEKLSKSDLPEVQKNIAENKKSNYKILKYLLDKSNILPDKDHCFNIKKSLANNRNCSLKILQLLYEENNNCINICLASNINTPTKILEELSKSSEINIRRHIANNVNTPVHVLETLSQDELTVEIVAKNTSTSIDVLKKLSKLDSFQIKRNIINNTSSTVEIIDNMIPLTIEQNIIYKILFLEIDMMKIKNISHYAIKYIYEKYKNHNIVYYGEYDYVQELFKSMIVNDNTPIDIILELKSKHIRRSDLYFDRCKKYQRYLKLGLFL